MIENVRDGDFLFQFDSIDEKITFAILPEGDDLDTSLAKRKIELSILELEPAVYEKMAMILRGVGSTVRHLYESIEIENRGDEEL